MFTGLIRAIGTLRAIENNQVQVSCPVADLLPELELGDSVAVDGVCLTVTQILPTGFLAAVSPETTSRTTLKQTTEEIYVNLEPSLRVGSKLGGHFVTGHIDGVGWLETAEQTENAWEMSFQVTDPRISRYIVPKGSVAINGVSLTVADCNATGSWFKVAVIPLTYAETNLQYLQPGNLVNLEGDVLGKYVEKFLRLGSHSNPALASWAELSQTQAAIEDPLTPQFLAEHGYL
ncbi:riboflavin synthase [Thermocoleostomius sinensis]|uniref:Riboflavin synthase n=1 Tax=Thermocoleostomius sinensis A174 TaxID=2016057 RepID=A0A9E8ZFF0_9CYAN|nr:riboflavin synthase [Thermocoleostomius sinensis]WAL62365.1 riboflavin synthase [Thermocoleostomius sinensis A174]